MKKTLYKSLLIAGCAVSLFAIPAAWADKCNMPCGNDCGQKCAKVCDSACPKKMGKAHHGRHHKDMQRHRCGVFQKAVKQLNLTEEQCAKAKVIVEKYEKQDKEAHQANKAKMATLMGRDGQQKPAKGERPQLTAEQKDAMHKNMEACRQEHEKAFNAFKAELAPILTAEQKAKLDAMDMGKLAFQHRHGMGKDGKRGPRGPLCCPERIAKELNLTEAQQAQLKDVFKKHEATRQEHAKKMREQMKAEFESFKNDVSEVLTDEQKAKFAELMKKNAPRHMGRPGAPGHHGKAMKHHRGGRHGSPDCDFGCEGGHPCPPMECGDCGVPPCPAEKADCPCE